MKKLVLQSLRILSKAIIKKYKPEIIAIAGSVGKTSTKEAVFAVLNYQYNVRKSPENYNNEYGVPLTIINAKSGGKNIFKWLTVYYRAIKLLLIRNKEYPEKLIIEYGVDHKGDLDYLISIAEPKIGILTAIAEEHLNEFKTIKGVLKEEEKILTKLRGQGKLAIVNNDDELAMSVLDEEKVKVQKLTYGLTEGAAVLGREVQASGMDKKVCESQYEWDCHVWGMQFKITYKGATVPVFLPHCFGEQHVYAALAAAAVGVAYNMNLVDISEALRLYRPPRGRMRILAGIKHTFLIDDTYNASPRSTRLALEMMMRVPVEGDAKRVAVLGDMLELDAESQDDHREIGFLVQELGVDYLVAVGPEAQAIAQAAEEAGMKGKVKHFETSQDAGRFVQELMGEGDVVLVKGSQGVRMEKVVKEIMAEPQKAQELLVRQSAIWLNR